ncbi:Uncharacterised protein [Mycobacteroides abscessus subsp. abscessus]|uniref:hypothetical protein n=1 Tax=Mycobacteroides abscessus TaxID=36809 RepID=UPI000927C6DD|nr:hypothetical protein [Mycobacteroides abscessus]SIJ22338.1 Uncharacterised protein [Mycobacteroides abscessus subsp. abscessus]SLH38414.1 Uncharacterised protein [Mycobacteroides abscessus subsp. abscessus]
MIALQITATTPHGVVLARPWGIPLDALLASVIWHRKKTTANEAGGHLKYHPDDEPEQLELPLQRCGDHDDQDWHWMATFSDHHPRTDATADPDIRWRTSRTDHLRLQQLTPSIGSQVVSDSSGRYQQRVIPAMAHIATTLTWRAVGDPDPILELLTDLQAIGKNRGVGEGLVTRWSVITTPEVDLWSAGHEHAPGVLGRSIPIRCVRGTRADPERAVTATIRPPYLHPGSRVPAVHPQR